MRDSKGTTTARDMADILRGAKDRLTISGHTLDKLSQDSRVREALIDVLNRGVQVTVMQLNPRSLHAAALKPYHQLESDSAASDQDRQTLVFLQHVFKALLPESRPRLRVLLTNYMSHFQTVIVDESVFVYFYMYGTDVDDTPDLVLMSADPNDTLRRRLISSTGRQMLAPETVPYIQQGHIYEHWEHSKLASWDRWTPEERNAHRITHEFYVTYAAHVHQRVGFTLEKEVKAHLDLLRGRTLVLGCGSGKEVDHLASKRPDDQVLGVDFSPEAIALAKSSLPKLAERFVVGDLYDMEALFDGTFDSIAANAALVHLLKRDDLELVLRMIWDKLSPGGRAFIRALYKEAESGPLKEGIDYQDKRWNAPRWFVYYSRDELVAMSRHIGFNVLDRETRDIAVTLLGLSHEALSDALSKGFPHDELENAYWSCILLEKPLAVGCTVESPIHVDAETDARPGSSAGRPALVSWLADRRVSLDGLALGSALGELLRRSAGAAPSIRAKVRTDGESPLRVLMPLCQKVGATGSGVVVREVVDQLARRGVSSLVLCGAEAGEPSGSLFESPAIDVESVVFGSGQGPDLPFPIVGMSDRMPYPSTRFLDLTVEQLEAYLEVWRARVTQCIRRFQPHVIHVHHFWLLAATSAACAGNLPLIVSVHGTDLQQAHNCPHLRELVTPWGSRIDRIVALTEDSASEVREVFAVHPARISVLGNGFNDKLFHPLEDSQHEVLERYRIGALAARHVILFVGKHVEWKGVVWLLHAFAAVAVHRPDAVLVIGGAGPETERRRYVALARSLGVEDKVYFTGAVAYGDVGPLMNLASVFVLPSYREPFGLVLLEALACGSRIVATDQGGPAEFVPNELKVSGDAILVPGPPDADPSPPDSASFAQRLANAIGVQLDKPQSVEKRRQIAASVSHLTWDRYVDELLALYRSIDGAGVLHR
jgi:glycosyltransferase involved in cell wall biosynthesis/SAM-dependent methyltransferase